VGNPSCNYPSSPPFLNAWAFELYVPLEAIQGTVELLSDGRVKTEIRSERASDKRGETGSGLELIFLSNERAGLYLGGQTLKTGVWCCD